ncbi:hypothetical protein RGQ21_68120 [Kitasatospora aureofaciens]|nr:hypothetical protein RGQ21_68120 [Kitasatospora aureofaciens]
MFTVIVTGSRDLGGEHRVFRELESLFAVTEGCFRVRHGGCPTGADWWASVWCDLNGDWDVHEIPHVADWDHCGADCPPGHRKPKAPGDIVHPGLLDDYCPKAGPRRNAEMAALGADLCLAFPLGKSYGTWNCVNECKKAGIPVKVIK